MADPVSFRKGTIVSYDQATGDNVVEVGGANVADIPVLGVAEAATYAPGVSVGVLVVDTGGSQSWFIIGRIVRPNTNDYVDAVNRLSNSIFSEQVDASESTTNTSIGDRLTTIGPIAYPVVKSSGKLLILLSCVMIADDTDIANGGIMTVEIKDSAGSIWWGAGTLPNLSFYYSDNAAHALGDSIAYTRAFLVTGFPADTYTVTAKYAAQGVSLTTFAQRNVTCIAL